MGAIGQFAWRFARGRGCGCGTAGAMGEGFSVLIPFERASADEAAATAASVRHAGVEVVVAGPEIPTPAGVTRVTAVDGRGAAVRSGVAAVDAPCTILLEPGAVGAVKELAAIARPILVDDADVVVAGSRGEHPFLNRLVR